MFLTSSQKSRQLRQDLLNQSSTDINTSILDLITSTENKELTKLLEISKKIDKTCLMAKMELVSVDKIDEGLQDVKEMKEIFSNLDKIDFEESLKLLMS